MACCCCCLRATNMQSCPEQLVKVARASSGKSVSWIWWSASLSKGCLQLRCPRRICCVTPAERAVTPVMAERGTASSSHRAGGQTSQRSVKLITAGTCGHCFVTGPCIPTSEVSLTDKWMDLILSGFEPHTMQIRWTSRRVAPYSSLWWPNWPRSNLSASPCLSFSYCFLICWSLTRYYPFYCFVAAHIALIRLMWEPCLSCKWFHPCLPLLEVFSVSSRRVMHASCCSLCFVLFVLGCATFASSNKNKQYLGHALQHMNTLSLSAFVFSGSWLSQRLCFWNKYFVSFSGHCVKSLLNTMMRQWKSFVAKPSVSEFGVSGELYYSWVKFR